MTVITKPIFENKGEKLLGKALVVNEHMVAEPVDGTHGPPAHQDEVDVWMWTSDSSSTGSGGRARRGVSTSTTVCVFITILTMLSVAIIGAVYIYRTLSHNQVSRFHGWCGVPFRRNSLGLFSHQSVTIKGVSVQPWPESGGGGSMFQQQFDLDLGTDDFEKIFVPDFGIGRKGSFVHDFSTNKTAIIDHETRRCFVLPLDRGFVLRPQAMFRVLRKLWHGEYDGDDMRVVRAELRVVRPPINDVRGTSRYIAEHCADYTTYRLQKVLPLPIYASGEARPRRDAAEGGGADAQQPLTQSNSRFTVAEFTGKAIMEFTIIDE